MADRGVDLSALPKEVRDQLAELDLELSEGKVNPLPSLPSSTPRRPPPQPHRPGTAGF